MKYLGVVFSVIAFVGASLNAVAFEWQSTPSATSYEIRELSQNWAFRGELPEAIESWQTSSGADAVGRYTDHVGATSKLRYEIRLYDELPVARFAVVTLAERRNDLVFPKLTQFPSRLSHLSFDGNFGVYSFKTLGVDAPWLFFNESGASFVLSPGANFAVANQTLRDGKIFEAKVLNSIKLLPKGFRHETWLVTGAGPNATFETWGEALRKSFGKVPGPESEALSDKLGYWTDRGGGYYYEYENSLGYEGTLLAVKDAIQAEGVKLGYLQLDSWWYPKGSLGGWSKWHILSGIHTFTAAEALFPNGLADFQRRLGAPLAVHSRWIDSGSPYRARYKISGNVPVDDELWQKWMSELSEAGVVTYEQDWLSDKAHSAWDLTNPEAFLGGMSRAAADHGITIQYCMPLPRHYLASVAYPNVTTIRTSNDRFERAKWKEYLYGARLAKSLALRPWSDVFRSAERENFLLSLLAGGVTGIGDRLSEINGENIRRAARADGRLVKPDTPAMPLDRAYLEEARGEKRPLVSVARTEFGGGNVSYVFAYDPWNSSRSAETSFSPVELGYNEPVILWQPFTSELALLSNPSVPFETNVVGNGRYFVASPVNAGLAVLGDRTKFVPMGRGRVSALERTLRGWAIEVAFAPGESGVKLLVWNGSSSTPPVASLESVGSVGACQRANELPTGLNLWECPVSSSGGGASTRIRLESAE